MTDAEILALIRRALDDVVPDRSDDWKALKLDANIEDLDLDSIATMEMIGFLEEETDTTLPDDELPEVTTLADLARLVRQAA